MLIVYCFFRVKFGIKSTPFLLNATIVKHMNGYLDSFQKFSEKFLRDLNVDDSTVSVNAIHA